ncbi:rho GTPase-activating protein Graf isoform X2 [Drosophila willistoni]|uniref:rho GTPase-activating protein Graf isoform X2 n=1 Tax=Drosophila willistoni TaxID=7260 RepID=UPI000C26D275|nr:rho GTPase-activating protein Graf isoform X2 [Drosophila willistoni]
MGGGKDIRRGLEPLEFEECIVDSPEFRDNLNRHEKELDHTSHQIKRIIKEVKDLMSAAKVLSTRMKQLAILLNDFNFECIGTAQTDDENVICESLKRFGAIIGTIEDEREKMLTLADKHIIESLEDFRKKQIGGVKENKKKFDKKTEKFCQSQERFLNMSTKKPENTIQEADASLGMHEREYIQESLSYVLRIQEVQERIKFEFVEILLAFISGWLVFYHTAHEQAEDHRDYLQDLRHKVQKTRENFEEAREKVTELKTKYMEKRTKSEEIFTKRGYLFLMEKKPFKATWTKYYCTFKKQKREFTMLQFNQMNHSFTRPEAREDEKLTLFSCQRRASEFEKRFCFDLTFKEKPGIVYTFQALSEKDHRSWLSAMDGTEPTYLAPGKMKASEAYQLDETGFMFVRRCIQILESRGLEDEGIYRKSGVGTKINKLLALGMERKETDDVFCDEKYRDLMESNTIASALKMYLRNLNEPLMTYQYHSGFIEAAKKESLNQRVNDVHKLVYKLPQPNFEMLDMVIRHLTEVSRKYEKNKMSVFNLGVVFGPTLLRPLEETVAAILDIKFNNIVINILIENYERIFKNDPSSGVVVSGNSLATGTTVATAASVGNVHTIGSSPPTRMPRASQVNKTSSSSNVVGGGVGVGGGGGGGGSIGRNSMYSPQQKVYRVVTKSNYTDSTMSSSLQNIPNGMIYAHGPASASSSTPPGGTTASSSSNGGGGGGGSSSLTISPHATSNGARPAQLGSIKNLHSMTQSDISGRRSGPTSSSSSDAAAAAAVYGILGAGASTNGGTTLQAHHATPATATNSLRHADYLMATATPVTQSASSSHIYSNPSVGGGGTASNRLSLNNVSPPTAAMRKERLMGGNSGNASSAGGGGGGPQQHPPVQRSHFGYGQAKHYSPVAAASTSSSNESVCDSLSSNNGLGGGGGSGGGIIAGGGSGGGGVVTGSVSNANVARLLNTRSSIDYAPIATQASSLSTLLGSTCDDIVTATAAPSMIGGAGMGSLSGSGSTNESTDYAPTKMHRNRDINQIKRDLSTGTARVRTLYACMGESEGELSFEPNQIITNVRFSHEPGWLQGTLNGKTGLIPENYVEHLKPYH